MASNPSRPRYSDLPKPDSAEGVGDWARKIRDFQRQIDDDEEAEHRRLQEEIAASRIARKRRSKGVVSPVNADFAPSEESATAIPDLKSLAERQLSQAEAFNKLNGPPNTPSKSEVTTSIASARAWMASASTSATTRPSGPVSLAAFMGGRATGPILNKHAPQQDAHDPMQFEDRTHITSPHPVFGRGGVAMPGLTASNRFPRKDSASPVISPKYAGGRAPIGSSSSARELSASPTKAVDETIVPPQKTENRDRTASTPSSIPASPQKNGFRERTVSSPSPAFAPATGPSEAATEHIAPPHETRKHTIGSPGAHVTPARAVSATSSSQTPALSRSPPSHQAPVTAPSLAKAIKPDPKPSPQAPRISLSPNTSPAFLKPPTQKEPTPSLSRLQGRGFVQNMVKASHKVDSPPPSAQTTPDRPLSNPRKASVLDRWQPQESVVSSPPVLATKPLGMRKSWTVDTSPQASKELPAQPVEVPLPRYKDFIRPTRDSSPMLDPQGTGLGSATTLVVFKPSNDEVEAGSFGSVNELGVKHSAVGTRSPNKLPVAAGKPLNHPTKDRARKAKKSREITDGAKDHGSSATRTTFTQVKITPSPESEYPTSVNPSRPAPVSSNGSGRITDRWHEQGIIGIKPVSSRSRSSDSEPFKVEGEAGRRLLPGFAVTQNNVLAHSSPSPPVSASNPATLRSVASPVHVTKESFEPTLPKSPSNPSRHSRIPSTGNRATVMDVAQAFAEPENKIQNSPTEEEDISSLSSTTLEEPQEPESLPPLKPSPRQNVHIPVLERRRSSYNSAVTLPPLQEEVTPTPTPAGTLARGTFSALAPAPVIHVSLLEAFVPVDRGRKSSEDSDIIQIDFINAPLPDVDIGSLLTAHQQLHLSPNEDLRTVSLEVLVISGGNASILSRELNIFYDAEILAIVHRFKSQSSGLVATTVWGWFGKSSVSGDLDQAKLQELAQHYRTTLIVVNQCKEPVDMLQVLGNQLIVRQGKRVHWSSDNTAMHVIRSRKEAVLIDEQELSIRNLCSGFSYCITVLDTVYVWYGRGSVASERKAALEYGHKLGSNIVELREGDKDGDEMLWMILGEDSFANANYWQWRITVANTAPRAWKVLEDKVQPVDFLDVRDTSSVYLLDCVWELFVLVGSEARSQRQNIRLALHAAANFARRVAGQRPHDPPVHVLIFPSQVPLDLKMHFREIDEILLNSQQVPDHMNLLSLDEAHDHLQRTTWARFSLRDPLFLPLGIHPVHLE